MIIELPEKFDYGQGIEVVDGILKISSRINWRKFVYGIVIATKGNECWYCGKTLGDGEITMDHLYPQALGGLTIPENLAPSCKACNNQKSNLTEQQYRDILKAPSKDKKTFRSVFLAGNERKKARVGYVLPDEWITTKHISNILLEIDVTQEVHNRRYLKIERFYREYKKLPYPIVVDRNNYLLDGFLVLMFAKNNSITKIPTIVMENVEIVFQK